MDSKLQNILDELYALDPSLKARESELLPVITALLKAKPDVALDQAFANQLRQRLLTSSNSRVSKSMPSPMITRLVFAGFGCLIAVVVAVPVTYELTRSGATLPEFALSDVSTAPNVNSMGREAFGSLIASAGEPLGSTPATLSSISPIAYGLGGGPQATDSAVESADTKLMAGSPAAITVGEYYPGEVIKYVYSYAGTLDLSGVSDAVYRKAGGLNLHGAGNDLAKANLGPVDLSKFGNLSLQSFNLIQSDDNGYSVYVDPQNGSITINGNQGLWSYDNYRPLTDADVVADSELITAADNFLNNYGIDTAGFGSPVVDDRGVMYALSQPVGERYIPDIMNVTYPLLLDGQPAYSGDGSAYGLFVMVNVRTKAVVSATINVASSYDRSSYELERDATKVMSLVSQGGLYNYNYGEPTQTITIELGEPEVILVSHYNYTGSSSETLFVPALSFPITKNSDTNPVYQDSVIVPLVKSVIDQAAQEPIYRILEEDVKAQ